MVGLNALLEKHKGQKLAILGFPCNQFGHQEPGTSEETLKCYRHIRPGECWEPHPDFTILKKIEVNGSGENAVYSYLKNALPPSSATATKPIERLFWDVKKDDDITWNFEKFIIDKAGKPRFRFSPKTAVESLHGCIEELINE